MKRSLYLLITAILGLLIGITCLLTPEKMADGFGMAANTLVLMLIREAGAANLGMGYLNFAVRNHPDSRTMKTVLLFNMVYHLLILPANLYGWSKGIFTLSQVGPAFAIHLLLAIGFLWYAVKIKAQVKA